MFLYLLYMWEKVKYFKKKVEKYYHNYRSEKNMSKKEYDQNDSFHSVLIGTLDTMGEQLENRKT